MNLTYDRQITISVGNSRRDLNWKRQSLKVSELYERLHVLVRSDETLDEYMRMSKGKQDDRCPERPAAQGQRRDQP